MLVERMVRIHTVPETLHCAVCFPRHRHEELPILEPLAREPAGGVGTNVEGARQRRSHRLTPGP